MGLCVINIVSFFYIDKKLSNVEYIDCYAKIVSIKEEKEYKNKYVIEILKLNNLSNIGKVKNIEKIKLIIYTEKNDNFIPGDIVKIEGVFSKPETRRNFGGFDYSKYLKQFKIFGTINVEKIEVVSKNITISENLLILRMCLIDKISDLYTKESAGFLKGLLFGKTDELSEDVKKDFKNSSISHVIAISGQHFNYIILCLKFIFDKIIENKKLKNYSLILFLIVFSNLTGNPVSGIRACIMCIMIYLASNFERKNNFYFSLIYSWIIIIIYNPYNIYNIGLWLSYMGTLGIVMFFDFLKKYFYYNSKKNKECFKNIKNKFEVWCKTGLGKIISNIFKYIIENFLLTISAQILIFPIIMYCFNIISFSFFISNILISFIVGPVLIFGYISVILSFFNFPFFKIIIIFEEFLIQIILNIAENCAKLPLSQIYVLTPNFVFVLLFYFIILVFVYLFHMKKIYVLRLLCSNRFAKKEFFKLKNNFIYECIKLKNYYTENKFERVNKRGVIFKILCFALISLLILVYINDYQGVLEINFVDVGQGDCTYIKTPKGKNIIIDAGEGNSGKYDYGEKVVLPYLLDKKVKKIDYLIISHADSDHIGGVFSLIENLYVKRIIIGIQSETSEQYEKLLEVAKNKKINIYHLSSNDKILVEKDICLEVLWPQKEMVLEENALNNNSLVFKFNYKEFSILFTGDIEGIAEEAIVKEYEKNGKLKSKILKVAHHGSKTSTINMILEKINPQIALIGVGKNNKFGHPNEEVIEKIERSGAYIFRTDINGEINILVNKCGKVKVKTRF